MPILGHFRPFLCYFWGLDFHLCNFGQKPTFFSYLFKKMYIFYIVIKKPTSTYASYSTYASFLDQLFGDC